MREEGRGGGGSAGGAPAAVENPDSKRARRQAMLLDKAQISTLHAFCNAMLRQHFHRLALDPEFSILDPETTYTLPERQTANGIVDSWVHVLEQYLTYPVNAPLQDRQAEAVMLTLVEEAPKVTANPRDYDARANIMWCATHALNGIIGRGVRYGFLV